MIDLAQEFNAAMRKGFVLSVKWFKRRGVTAKTLYLNPVGIDLIDTTLDGTYQPFPDGKLAFIMPANCYGNFGEDIDDLIAWEPKNPTRWWLRLGIGRVLNHDAIGAAASWRFPLALRQSPFDWLRAGGDLDAGAVILDRNADLRTLLADVPKVVAASYEHGIEIERQIERRSPRLPRIILPGRAAA